jgi:hypothetical protein
MTYTPQNLDVYTAAFAGAIAGAGVPSGAFIVDPTSGDYAPASTIATVFAQAVDTAWGSATANAYDIEAITDAACNLFVRGAGYPVSGVVTTQGNWTIVATALVALIRQGDAAATAGGIVFPPLGGSFTNLSNVLFVDKGTTVALSSQTGNIERPFATLQQLNAGLPHGGTARITPGDYTGSGPLNLTVTAPICLTNQADNPEFVGQLVVNCPDITAVSTLSLINMYLSGTVTASTLSVQNGTATKKLTASSFIRCNGTEFSGLTGVIDCGFAECIDCTFDAATNRTVVTASTGASFQRCIFKPSAGIVETISVAAGTSLTFKNCEFSLQFGASTPVIEFTGAPGNLVYFDEPSMVSFIAAGGTLVNCDATSSNMPALTNVYYLDVSSSAITGDESGHIEKPLRTLSQLAALPGSSSILVVPGDYSGAPVDFSSATSIAIANASSLWHNRIGGSAGTSVVLPRISCVNGDLLVQGCSCSSGIDQTNIVTLKQCNFASTVLCNYAFFEDSLSVNATVNVVIQGDFANCIFHTAAPGNTVIAAANNCQLTLRNCTFRTGDNPVIAFASGSNNVNFDEESLNSFLAAGGTITNGQYLPVAGPISGNASFGPLTLAPGQTTVASLVLPDVFAPDVLAIAGVVTATKPGAFIISATYVAITHTLEIYADNYTGAPIVLTDAVTLRWRMIAP